MKKELSVRRLFIDSLHFIRSNILLLGALTVLSFIGFYVAASVAVRNLFFFMGYGAFIYIFYYTFVGLYLEKKPILTAERFVESFVKLLTLFLLSFAFWLSLKVGYKVVCYACQHLAFLSDLYAFLRQSYHLIADSAFYSLIRYLVVIALLAFSFFIPGLAWIAAIDEENSSVTEAYARVQGNYLKTAYVFVLLYGLLPLFVSIISLRIPYIFIIAVLYTLQTIFQLIVYLHLYDFFYKDEQ